MLLPPTEIEEENNSPSSPQPKTPKPLQRTESTEPPQASAVRLSNFQPTKTNLKKKNDGKLHLRLSGGDRLVVLGNYGLRVISGEVTLNGALLKAADKTHWVSAPQCYALPVLRCSDEAAIELAPHPAAESLESLDTLSPLFRRLWNDEDVANTNGKTRQPKSTFELIDELVAASRSKQVSVMVTGPKSSGKSTFGRLLTNNLITYYSAASKRRHTSGVAVLDLDPGQPEYCIAGQIGLVHVTEPLLGPAFCRPLPGSGIDIIRSHTLASMSPDADTDLYTAVAIDLINHYRNRLGGCPLIINMSGYVQGAGLDIITSLIGALKPTDLVYMASDPIDVVRSLQESMQQGSFAELPSQTTHNNSRTAAQLRTMQTMSYFHAERRQDIAPNFHFEWNPSPLTMTAPWIVKYSGPTRGILGIMCYGTQWPDWLLADAINGTVVAVVEIESPLAFQYGHSGDAMDLDSSHDSQPPSSSIGPLTVTTPERLPYINTETKLDPKYSQTIGLALIRGIDVAADALQILTPIPKSKIEEVTERSGQIVLVSGKFDTPKWSYTEDLYYRSHNETTTDDNGEDIVKEDIAELDHYGEEAQQGDVNLGPTSTPYIEELRGNEKRGAASKVWKVRRDLGRTGGGDE
ncbi:protein GRC3 [Apiospora kogelbergensis]|uniref:protein GRC3 n=1 Tax=Apiospora kogelbergensis TaxID=1337665 RepID=UPI0031312940